ncbi:MAG: class I SAM-dependent methyltransferase [Candidatus Bathyarchaeia archaeon]
MSSQNDSCKIPERLAFTLDNPIRRFLDPPERLIGKLSIDPDDTVVDFGCGPGYFLIPLAKVARRAIGVDVSPRMLEKASTKAKKKGVSIELLQNNGTGIRLEDNSADLIFLNHVFHEVDDKPTVLGEFHRILKPAGRLAIVERTHDSWRLLNNLRPPVVDEKKLISEIQQTGFRFAQTIAHGNASIVISQKA